MTIMTTIIYQCTYSINHWTLYLLASGDHRIILLSVDFDKTQLPTHRTLSAVFEKRKNYEERKGGLCTQRNVGIV